MTETSLRNCPPEFYQNCRNAIRCCRQCRAGSGSPEARLFYIGQEEIGRHPFYHKPKKVKQIDHAKSAEVKRALKAEAKTAERIARKTVASGRVNHDGDLLNLDTLRVEHKLRKAGTETFTVTASEYRKGLEQGIDVWAIKVDRGPTVYFLKEETYCWLLSLAAKALGQDQLESEQKEY